MVDLIKSWKSIKLFVETCSADQPIYVDYQIDDDSTWTTVTGVVDTTPSEELDFSSATPPELLSRRIRYRLRFYTNDYNVTPELNAVRIDAYGIAPPKYRLDFPVALLDGHENINVQEKREKVLGTYDRLETGYAKLKAAVAAGTSLTLNARWSVYDSKTVILASVASRGWRLDSKGQIEGILLNVVVHER
jgi:hypothetical protein